MYTLDTVHPILYNTTTVAIVHRDYRSNSVDASQHILHLFLFLFTQRAHKWLQLTGLQHNKNRIGQNVWKHVRIYYNASKASE